MKKITVIAQDRVTEVPCCRTRSPHDQGGVGFCRQMLKLSLAKPKRVETATWFHFFPVALFLKSEEGVARRICLDRVDVAQCPTRL